ncbi:MAG: hypothetical protein Q9222_000402 [Ikaeria aurantiellina]
MARKTKREAILPAVQLDCKHGEGVDMVRKAATPTAPPLEADFVKKDEVTNKRLKSSASVDLDIRPPKRLKTTASSIIESPPHSEPALAEVQHLHNQYAFSTMSIMSSSKISQKVRLLLDRIQNPKPGAPNIKPSVVVLGAKAASTSKMISVVEIAKADITKRGGVWYQYSKLRSEILPYKANKSKRSDQSRPATDERRRPDTSGDTGARPPQPGSNPITAKAKDVDTGDSDDEGEAFEILQQQSGSADVGGDTKVRATPLMNIYLSCVRIPDLEDLLG